MFVEHLRELLHGGFSETQFAHHLDALVQSFFQFMPKPYNFGMRADEEEAALVLRLAELAAQSQPHQFLLQIDQGETNGAKKPHHHARRNKVEDIHDQHQANGHDETTLEERPENVPARAKEGVVVKALGFKNERRGGNQRNVQPDDRVKYVRWDHLEVQPCDDLRIGAQRIRNPETHREQTGVRHLVDLRSNLTITSQHGFLISTVKYCSE